MRALERSPGVSVVICCHNSAALLPATLKHLANQTVNPSIPWDVVVVDNASTDDTAAVAQRLWSSICAVPLRVVHEPKLGLSYARRRGIAATEAEIIGFVDDDNWLCSGWVQTAYEVMRDHPDVGALGGIVEPEFETQRPGWFGPVAYLYATGPEGEPSGDVTGIHMLCGAGLNLRRRALADIGEKGFRPIAVDRQGSGVGAGGDSEMTYCLRLAGWRLRIDPRLRLRHFLPAKRLQWDYARRLAYGSAFATPERDALVYACKPPRSGLSLMLRKLRERWFWQLCAALTRLVPAWVGVAKRAFRVGREGDSDVLQAEFLWGRIDGLVAARRWYNDRSSEIRGVMRRLAARRHVRG